MSYRNTTAASGFSLIEIIIVIAILGILATLILTQISSFRERANQANIQTYNAQIEHQFTSDCLLLVDLDEATSTTPVERCTNMAATIPAAITSANGVDSKKALNFNGITDYVSFGTDPRLSPTVGTISFFFKANTPPVLYDGLVGKTNGGQWTQGWAFYFVDSKTVCFFSGAWSTNYVCGNISNVLVWNHLAATWNGTNLRLFINGQLAGSIAYTGSPQTNNPMEIGRVGNDAWDFNGLIDNVRIYAAALP